MTDESGNKKKDDQFEFDSAGETDSGSTFSA
jgi:hypothetical protein